MGAPMMLECIAVGVFAFVSGTIVGFGVAAVLARD
jgi:hypothetical protein